MAKALLDQATKAEAQYQIDRAIDRLYELVLEHPRTPESQAGRLRLARLLALAGDTSSAMLQCQSLRNETAPDSVERQAALDLATTLARRLRASGAGGGNPFYLKTEAVAAPSGQFNEPTAIVADGPNSFVVVDTGGKRILKSGTGGVQLPRATEPTAAAVLPDGTLVVADRMGFWTSTSSAPAPYAARGRSLGKVRAIAANSRGDLFVADRDFDGVLRCQTGGTSCGSWGPPGKVRSIAVSKSDFVYLLDEGQQTIRVTDDSGKLLTAFGPMVGSTQLDKVVDIAVDAAYTVYILDGGAKRLHVGALRQAADGRISIQVIASITIPTEGEPSIKNPSAIGVTASGAALVAGRGAARLLKLQ